MLGVTTRLIFNDEEYEEFDGFFTYKVTFKLDKGIRSFKVISLNKGDTMREKDSKNSLSENTRIYAKNLNNLMFQTLITKWIFNFI